ncbi:MAG TPA: histidine kinase [Chitinophagaceae bacterium]|nr:histidine kinase [Chitinophagaceae bacterium]
MKAENNTAYAFNRIEFWGATVIYALAIFLLISNAVRHDMDVDSIYGFQGGRYELSYMQNYLLPKAAVYTALYLAYILLSLYVVPNLRRKNNLALHIILFIAVFAILGFIMGIADTWLKAYDMNEYSSLNEFYNSIFKTRMLFAFWMMFLFAMYNVIKFFGIYLLTNEHTLQEKYKGLTREAIIVFILWMISFFLTLVAGAPQEIVLGYAIIIPFGIGLYWYSMHTLIPSVINRPKRKFLAYALKVFQILVLTAIPFVLLTLPMLNRGEAVAAFLITNACVQLFVTAPVSWFVYKYKMSNKSELVTLRQALGTSTANLDLLKSQINPHFLFNSLNTLYGTALQENADRTSEGIQKLGDMMRFMLEENVQDRISLNREIDYIKNYISLQKLRTQESPNINIQTNIDDGVHNLNITPMLLIPFIENAFKHGISLREPSHIKITLHVEDGNIYFDVYNSIHTKQGEDPEKDNTGIGLNNVKQRLQLFYPNKHELIIRENSKEFFIHLTIQLTQFEHDSDSH